MARSGDDVPEPLVISPLVYAIGGDRASVLLAAAARHAGAKGGVGESGAIRWQTIHDVVASTQGSPAIGGKADWGFVKLRHTHLTKSNSDLQGLLLMTLELPGKYTGLAVADILDRHVHGRSPPSPSGSAQATRPSPSRPMTPTTPSSATPRSA